MSHKAVVTAWSLEVGQPASPLQPESAPAAAQLQLPHWHGAPVPAAGAAGALRGAPPAPARSSAAAGPAPGPAAVPAQPGRRAQKQGAPLWHGSALPGPALHELKMAEWQVDKAQLALLRQGSLL